MDAGSAAPPENMDITPYVPSENKPQDPEKSPHTEPSSSSYVQNTMRQEQHNQFAALNIVNQGPNEDAVIQLVKQGAMEVGKHVHQVTTREVTHEMESLRNRTQ